ncbi:hypothetical protein [Roseibium album]|uniref:hypothetical protein n=1 Tax=Roseibium album TaxID=311410 RepID=UPI003BAEB8BA
MERRKEQMEEREQNLKWMLAFMLVVAGLSVLVATGGALIGAYIEFGLRGPLVLIVSCLALFVAVAEVKTRI